MLLDLLFDCKLDSVGTFSRPLSNVINVSQYYPFRREVGTEDCCISTCIRKFYFMLNVC